MKTFVLIALLSLTNLALADHYDNKEILKCRVTRMVDYTYFEESLSANEYPDIEVAVAPNGQLSVGFGGNGPFEAAEGDKVTVRAEKYKGTFVQIQTQHGDIVSLETEWRTIMARGRVTVKERGESKTKTLAYVMCDKGIL